VYFFFQKWYLLYIVLLNTNKKFSVSLNIFWKHEKKRSNNSIIQMSIQSKPIYLIFSSLILHVHSYFLWPFSNSRPDPIFLLSHKITLIYIIYVILTLFISVIVILMFISCLNSCIYRERLHPFLYCILGNLQIVGLQIADSVDG
jgi:hypothetical protein